MQRCCPCYASPVVSSQPCPAPLSSLAGSQPRPASPLLPLQQAASPRRTTGRCARRRRGWSSASARASGTRSSTCRQALSRVYKLLGFKQHFADPPSSLKVQASFQGAWGLDYQCSPLCTNSFLPSPTCSRVSPRHSSRRSSTPPSPWPRTTVRKEGRAIEGTPG